MNGVGSPEPYDTLVVGAGQAGLAMAWHLARRGRRFLVVDAGPGIGHSWQTRWDSLRLFTPAEHDALPGTPFPAPTGHHPGKDEVAAYLREYAARASLPVRTGTRVTRLTHDGDVFTAATTSGTLRSRQVVVATGPFQQPVLPVAAERLHPAVVSLHSSGYRNPAQLPRGLTLVVGAGNSGMQIAAELAGDRPTVLAVGARPTAVPQRIAGRDLFWWLTRLGLMAVPSRSPLGRRFRARGDLLVGSTWRGARRAGVRLGGRVVGVEGRTVTLADGCMLRPDAVVWCTGFRRDDTWIDIPDVLTDDGPRHDRGLTDVPGLAFLGLPWQRTRGSSLLGFVRHDAAWLDERLAEDLARRGALTPSA